MTSERIVDLYEQVEFLTENCRTRAVREETLRDCLRRLDDGWVWSDLAGGCRPDRPAGWCWSRGTWGNYQREPMSELEVAAMRDIRNVAE